MSSFPMINFGCHIAYGVAGWCYPEVCLKTLPPFARFVISISIFSAMIYTGYQEHILCEIKEEITKSQITGAIHSYIIGFTAVLSSFIMLCLHYQRGKSKLSYKIFYYLIFIIVSMVVKYYTFLGSNNHCERDTYGKWFDSIAHVSLALLYVIWLHSIITNASKDSSFVLRSQTSQELEFGMAEMLTLPQNSDNIEDGPSVSSSTINDIDIIDDDWNIDENNNKCQSNCVCLIVSRTVGALLFLLFIIFMGISCIIGFIFIYVRLYILGT